MHKNKEFIRVDNVQASNNELRVTFSFSDKIKKYFKGNHLLLTFDQNIDEVNKSVLSIPALTTVVTVAWATGADVYLETIDSSFLKSLKNVESVFRVWYPKFLFSTEIHTDHIVTAPPPGERCALLFSGGLDSLTSYLRHKYEKPTLFAVWGGDVPIAEHRYWTLVKDKLQRFANQEALDIHFIKTNERELINDNLAARDFLGKASESWYGDVAHGLCLTTAAAPLLVSKYKTLLVASDGVIRTPVPFENKQPAIPREIGFQGSLLFYYANIYFGNTKIVYDNPELTRVEKVKQILKPNSRYGSNLIVCSSKNRFFEPSPQFLNCCVCDKCLRTIAELTSQNIDPRTCNFSLRKTEDALKLIKNRFCYAKLPSDPLLLEMWKDLKNITDENTGSRIPGGTDFFKWFKTFDLDGVVRTPVSMLNEKLPVLHCYSFISTRHQGIKHILGFLIWTAKRKIASIRRIH